MQREGYESKRGKYISARALGQEQFTRLKTLGADYTEETIASRITGDPRPPRQPQQCSGKSTCSLTFKATPLKPGCNCHKASKGKKFLRGFENKIILFKAPAREIKIRLAKLSSSERLKVELDGPPPARPPCKQNFGRYSGRKRNMTRFGRM